MSICSLRSTMARDLALRRMAPPGARGAVHRWIKGKLLALAEVYLPYRLYHVTVQDRRVHMMRYYAVDAAAGTLDPYEFAAAPSPEAFVEVDTRNCHPVRLDEKQTNRVALEKVRRLMFAGGFFRLANPLISADLVQANFYMPYWAGFYGDEQSLKVVVFNAIRQTQEGSKVRQLVQEWLQDRSPLLSRSIA